MVCYTHSNSRFQNGSGVMDQLMRPFTYEKYAGERHAYSLNPKTFLTPFAFVGPNTAVKLREKLHDDTCLDDLDSYARDHDYVYLHEKEAYNKDHDKQKHINNIHRADDVFIQKAYDSKDEPIMGPIASKLIAGKKKLEEMGMDTKIYSGFGTSEEPENTDPVYKLRQLVKEQYKSEIKHKKTQKGGFILAPLAIGAATAIGSKIASELYDFVKKKIISSGSGVKIPNHKTKKEQLDFLKEFINRLK